MTNSSYFLFLYFDIEIHLEKSIKQNVYDEIDKHSGPYHEFWLSKAEERWINTISVQKIHDKLTDDGENFHFFKCINL